jgi:hypothetical protein
MADLLLDGNVKASWVPTISNIAAPTAVELTAGTALEQRLTPDGLDISFDTDMIDNSALGSTYSTELVGRSKVSITLKYKAATGASDPVATALVYAANGYLVVRRGTSAATAFAASQKVEVYPVQIGRPNPDAPAPNSIQTITVRMGSTGDPRGWDNPATVA